MKWTNKSSEQPNTPSVLSWISPSTSPSLFCLSVRIYLQFIHDLRTSSVCALCMLEVVLLCRQIPDQQQRTPSPCDLSGQRSSSSVWQAAYPPFWLQLRVGECVGEHEYVAERWVMALEAGFSAGGLRWTWSWVRSPP